jgi:hypothetical protein
LGKRRSGPISRWPHGKGDGSKIPYSRPRILRAQRSRLFPFSFFLSFFNAGRRERQLKTLEINIAPHSDSGNISFHISALRSRLAPNKKTLHLGESKLLPAAFQEIAANQVSEATSAQFPVLAALSFCVSALDAYTDYDRDRPEKSEIEYNFESIMDR